MVPQGRGWHGYRIEVFRAKTVSTLVVTLLLVLSVGRGLAQEAGSRINTAPGTYTNPILAGDWSDPGLIRVGHDYYSVRSTFGWQPGLPIVHSRDLLHWEYIGHGFASHPKLLPGDTRNGIWGVEMGWNPNTRQFLIYAPTRDGEVFVCYADKPEGPYRVKSLGANLGIDPGFFADDDGRLYFMTSRALIYELESDGLAIKRPVKQIDRTPYKLFEGPDIFKRGGYYYLLLSDGGTLPHEPSTITSLRARSLEGPWKSDPGNPVMFSTNSGARFESPAHGTLIDTPAGEWYIAYHAHEPAYYTLGRQFLMEPIEWTADGWWRPAGGKIPATSAKAPALAPAALAPAPLRLQQSDEFDRSELGLQWFFTCAPDFSGRAWSLTERPGGLRIRTQKGDLHSLEALPGIFQQRVIDKAFAFQTRVTFDARDGREAAGLHMYHDPLMNFWLATTVANGEKRIAVGKHTLGVRQELWSIANPHGDRPVHLKIVVSDPETATFFHSSDGSDWRQLGDSIYFGASGHHVRDGKRGDPDLGWVGRYKEPNLTPGEINGLPENQSQKVRMGNTWTAATFGVFAVQDGAKVQKAADFEYLRVSAGSTSDVTPVKAEPTAQDIRAGMKKATRFMAEKAALRGGYVWVISEDFKQRWGEVPARPSQIWVQQGTPMVGMTFLDAYEATGDRYYLEVARRTADALIAGQHSLGGWHYFIDFNPTGIEEWYRKEASRFKWGLEEYRHYYGNCTFDDRVTAQATRFLLRLYLLNKDAAYRAPLLKALDFVVQAQYPNGAWPQRFPLSEEFAHDGMPDYTSFYTLNDGAARGNIELLVEAAEKLGEERYLAAAKRAMDFLISVQGPDGQAAWAEQYGKDLKPAAARTHEPAGYVVRESVDVIQLLELFYLMTGERRYLAPIPGCLDWFDRIKAEAIEQKLPPARYYEPGSNRPIYVVRTEKTNEQGYGLYLWTSDPQAGPDVDPRRTFARSAGLRKEYERLAALTPDEARREYERTRIRPEREEYPRTSAAEILRRMDDRGAWVTDDNRVNAVPPGGMNQGPPALVRGISTFTYVARMQSLIDTLRKVEPRPAPTDQTAP